MMLKHSPGQGIADFFLVTNNHIGSGFQKLCHIKLMS